MDQWPRKTKLILESGNEIRPRYKSLSLQHDLPLYARNAHFDHVSQLVRL